MPLSNLNTFYNILSGVVNNRRSEWAKVLSESSLKGLSDAKGSVWKGKKIASQNRANELSK